MPSTYRWNTSDFATGYDAAADLIHPYYLAIQDAILDLLQPIVDRASSTPYSQVPTPSFVVDLGGGSSRLVERILDHFPQTSAIIIDQSEPFLALAERRLHRFGTRATCVLARLQDDL